MYSPAGTSTLTVEWFDCHLTADCFDNVRDIYYQILLSQLLIKPFICIIASIFSLTFGCSNGSPPAAPRPLPACINCSGHREARLTFSRWRHRTIFFFLHPFAEPCVSSQACGGLWWMTASFLFLSINKNSSNEKRFIVVDSPVIKVWKML